MNTKKIYAVKQGKKTGLFYSWPECEQQVRGYSGAQYKSFTTEDEANNYLGRSTKEVEDKTTDGWPPDMVAYIDGSYNSRTKEYSAGVVILYKGEKKPFNKKGDDPEASRMRNVAGEIMGSTLAIEYALAQGVERLEIYYDYAGIEKWCTGEWQAKTEGTRRYRDFYHAAVKSLAIRFSKVKAHSGVLYNEEADKLAKAALTESRREP